MRNYVTTLGAAAKALFFAGYDGAVATVDGSSGNSTIKVLLLPADGTATPADELSVDCPTHRRPGGAVGWPPVAAEVPVLDAVRDAVAAYVADRVPNWTRGPGHSGWVTLSADLGEVRANVKRNPAGPYWRKQRRTRRRDRQRARNRH